MRSIQASITCFIFVFRCDKCQFAAPVRSKLKYHIKTVHMDLKPYACEVAECHFRTISPLLLRQHINRVHLGQKPIKR